MSTKVKLTLLATGFIVLLTFFLSNKESQEKVQPDDIVQESTETITETIIEPTDEEIKKVAKKSNIATSDQLSGLLDEISQEISDCKKKINQLFPEDSDTKSLPYQSVKELNSALSSFFSITGNKLDRVNEVVKFFKENDTGQLDPKATFEKVSSLEDCGDFEEENVIDSVIDFLTEYNFKKAEQQIVSKHILNLYLKQLDRPVGLHHLVAKVESIESMIDEGLLPKSTEAELDLMNQSLEDMEEDFRSLIPKNFADKQFLTPSEILMLKQREDEVLTKLKGPLKDFIKRILENLNN